MAVTALTVGLAVPAGAVVSPHVTYRRTGPSRSVTICGKHDHVLAYWRSTWKQYLVRNPYWGSTGRTCVRTPGGRPGFTVTRTPRPNGLVTSFPDIYTGCIWNMCTPDTNIPIQTSRIHRAVTTWHTTERARGRWNAGYDIWFGKHRQTQHHANGAELMIWLNHSGGCCATLPNPPIFWSQGIKFLVQNWRPCDHTFHVCWKYIQFRMVRTRWSVDNLNLMPFLRYSLRHGWIKPWWWMENVEAGYEIWSGGVGLTTTNFRVRINGR